MWFNNSKPYWKNLNKEYPPNIYDDDDCKNILFLHFGFKALITMFCIVKSGAFKADIFRYAILYLEGGVYSDVDLLFSSKIRNNYK